MFQEKLRSKRTANVSTGSECCQQSCQLNTEVAVLLFEPPTQISNKSQVNIGEGKLLKTSTDGG